MLTERVYSFSNMNRVTPFYFLNIAIVFEIEATPSSPSSSVVSLNWIFSAFGLFHFGCSAIVSFISEDKVLLCSSIICRTIASIVEVSMGAVCGISGVLGQCK